MRPTESGGVLLPEQAAYDVQYYELALRIWPEDRRIFGTLTAHARIVHPTEWFVLDLDTLLSVESISSVAEEHHDSLHHERREGRIWIHLGRLRQPGEAVQLEVTYGGSPREASNPPWAGGFVWAQTSTGEPWIGVASQADGADIWWPCKDHPSDRPDSMAIRVTVPQPLVAAANGMLRGVTSNDDGTKTYDWFVSHPISNYSVSVNVAPYVTVEDTFSSVGGEDVPVTFWALPENEQDAIRMLPQFLSHLEFFEQHFGPYPFRSEKYGIAHTPYLGMEHQTIIAYGSNFQNNAYGFDWLHHHELAHEWFGNMVSVFDWRDFWIHEGFATYAQAIYAGELGGMDAYHAYMADMRPLIRNMKPVAPRESQSSREMYFVPPDYTQTDTDMYYKGAWFLHTLRYLVGDDAFFQSLRRMAYPDPALEALSDGGQSRFATTDDYLEIVEGIWGRDPGWLFEVYLRRSQLPRLTQSVEGGKLHLRWEGTGGVEFPLPVQVRAQERVHIVDMSGGQGSIEIAPGVEPVVDPEGWILRE